MGNRVNLVMMLGVPENFSCCSCRKWIPTGFRSYDIECGNPNPRVGVWNLNTYCNLCDNSGSCSFEVEIK